MATHHDNVKQQFGEQANAYLTSKVHAQGPDLEYLDKFLIPYSDAQLLDMGCGAGHVSFIAAKYVKQVTAYDLSDEMLSVVALTAQSRGFSNISVKQGYAECPPFADNQFDIVVSRYSAHHWHDVGKSLRELHRIIKPNGKLIIMDVVSPGHPVLDIWLQTIEAMRDTSHVRDYTPGEWLTFLTEAGFSIDNIKRHRLTLSFDTWVKRMRTPERLIDAIRLYQETAANDTKTYFELQTDGSFTTDMMIIETTKLI
ncbi:MULTISPECIES: class I SAM-dependent methyltransferase [unclassified Gilliamella]|uniref:class I SAM-dependent methyltransferase n=1 Tax=unclassified Gilliamella TaxID=2685620 RepID=UPI00226ABDFF|nr:MULTISPECIES: class I SAM-dependent methyltransferase [unclassified Gilliamella]MCX8642168.1 methyltransferase domain-containing protein [Gilliamella sp. B3835]MCX8707354.1 methyltransferase domain-containing protein [Gilliamella sp. B3783]MCX8710737.1 methyltransferase domain-containing protein [Gilliamella sp. B3780]MCX8713905.1 methyltransferase domain-containing protein [Gilliamella sp. B3781]MCX8716336.1 methyltransferase domain-containing protein [Gilliamella sp. B3784]